MKVSVALAACAYALQTASFIGGNLAQIQLTPARDFTPTDGRAMSVASWRINAAIAARVIERFSVRRNPAVLDYEHQTLLKEDNGQPAPAAGWIRGLEWRDGSGLWATVELTERAADFIRRGEYKFISPVFAYDAGTGEVLAITMAAITNSPAIDGMEPLALRAAASAGFIDGLNQGQHMTALTNEELAICNAAGVDPADFQKAKGISSDEALRKTLSPTEQAVCAATGADPATFIAVRDAKPNADTSGLTEPEIAMCRATGITPAQFAAARSR